MSRNTDSSLFSLTQNTANAEIDSLDVHGENHNFSEADEGNRARCMFCSTSQLSLVGKHSSLFRFPEGEEEEGEGEEEEEEEEEEEDTPLDLYQLLHEECSTCKPSDDAETQLCDFCRHIRLRHLLSCRSNFRIETFSGSSTSDLFERVFEVDFGGIEAVRSRQNCGLCRLVMDTISVHAQEVPEGSWSSISNFIKLEISLYGAISRGMLLKSNLLKKDITIVHKDLRPSVSVRHENSLNSLFDSLLDSPSSPLSPLGGEISWDRIRESLPNINPSPIGRLPSDFRLIDVEKRRCDTVGPSFDGTFAALSYVWGSATGTGVGQAWSAADLHNLPHTIEDALHACQQLGLQYLWVDQICIKQDDPTDKANQVASMAAIYSSASLVIVAARGGSVHSGLAGMHLARPKLQARESFLCLELCSVPQFENDISGSIWSTRGWTFQEAVLAKIKLYFSSTGVWLSFEKDGKEHTSSIEFKKPDGLLSSFESIGFDYYKDLLPLPPTAYRNFSNYLRDYTSRKLTYECDIYDAFSGIMSALFGDPDTDIYGLPEQHFDQGLLWAASQGGPHPSIRAFRNNLDRDPVPNSLLPTWSWASVTGGVEIAMTSGVFPLVKWARIAPTSQPPTPRVIRSQIEESIWDDTRFALNLVSNECRFFLAILWSYSCFDSPSPFAPQPNDRTRISVGDLTQRWPSPQDFWNEVSSGISKSPTYPGLDIPGITGQDDPKIAQLQPGVLLTRAQYAHVWVDPDGFLRDGDNGAIIGCLYGKDRGLVLRGDSSKTGVFKCVAISLAYNPAETSAFAVKRDKISGKTQKGTELSDENSWDLNFAHDCKNAAIPRPMINVMLIGREGQFSHRLGIGWVLLRRWIDAERVFETILLK